MANPLQIALIGAGSIFNNAHKLAFEQHPESLRLVAVADPNESAARAAAEKFGAGAFTDPRAMLDALDNGVQGVVITSPHYLHKDQAAMALNRGIPVLVEKPATCTAEELRELQLLEESFGGFLQAGQMQRFGREENWLKEWLRSPEFGTPRLFNIEIYQNIEGYIGNNTSHWILDRKTAGGGVIISVACHILDLFRYWFEDDFVEVYAAGRFDAPLRNGAESCAAITLKTRGGIMGTLTATYTAVRCPYSQRSLIFGSSGTLCQHLEQIGSGYAGQYFTATGGGKPCTDWNMMYSGWESVATRMGEAPMESPFVAQLLAFAENIRNRKAAENSIARNFNTLATIDAIGRGIVSGKVETVGTL